MYPTPDNPVYGIFVKEQIEAIQEIEPRIKFDILFINGKVSRINYLKAFIKMPFLSYQKSWDLIHAHYGFSGIIGRFQWRVPIIVTFHGSDIFLKWQRLISRLVAKFADRVIVPSARVVPLLNKSDAVVIPCGVNLRLFRPYPLKDARLQTGLPLNKKIVIFPGDPKNPVKGYNLFLQALDKLPISMQKNLHVVPLTGIKREMVPLYLSAADVLVICSDYESQPMVAKEAMACNLPIVSVDVGDVKELIDGIPGCYICSRSPEEIAARISEVLELHQRTNGRERIKKLKLDIKDIARRIISLYEEVLGEKVPEEKQMGVL